MLRGETDVIVERELCKLPATTFAGDYARMNTTGTGPGMDDLSYSFAQNTQQAPWSRTSVLLFNRPKNEVTRFCVQPASMTACTHELTH